MESSLSNAALGEGLVALPAPRQTRYGVLRAAPFTGDAVLPSSSEVVIIGGGIAGVATAYVLAKRGIPVLVCEKAELACEASSRAFGWVSDLLLEPHMLPLTQRSKQLWAELQASEGEVGYRRHGLAHFAQTPEQLGFFESWLASAAGAIDPEARILTPEQVAERFPTARKRFAGALFNPTDGSSEPIITTAAIAEAARRAGAKFVTGCAVRGLDLQAGRIAGVFTQKGYVKTSTVLCATNAWSRLFCGNHGVDVPQLYVIMSMGRSGVVDGPVGAGGEQEWAFRRQIDGSYALGGVTDIEAPVTRDAMLLGGRFSLMLQGEGMSPKVTFGRVAWRDLLRPRRWNPQRTSPFEDDYVLCGTPAPGYAQKSLRRNAEVFPEFTAAGVAEEWCGALTLTPDDTPIAGAVDAIPGFHLITACSYGISWAPALGEMLADIMTGKKPSVDPRPFKLSRFSSPG